MTQPDINQLRKKLRKDRPDADAVDLPDKNRKPALVYQETPLFRERISSEEKTVVRDSDVESSSAHKSERTKFKKPTVQRNTLVKATIITSLLVITMLLIYVFTPLSNIDRVTIAGHSHLTAQEVLDIVSFKPDEKIFLVNLRADEERLIDHPSVLNAYIERDSLKSLRIEIEENRIIGYLESDDGFYPIMSNGYMMTQKDKAPSEGPLLYHFEGEHLDLLIEGLQLIDNEIITSMSEIYHRPYESSQFRIQIFMTDGQEVIANLRTLPEKMNYYTGMRRQIENSSDGVIDIEVGSSFLPYTSNEALELKASLYGEDIGTSYTNAIREKSEPLKEILRNFTIE